MDPTLDLLPEKIKIVMRGLSGLFAGLITTVFYLLKKSIGPQKGEIIFFPDATWNISSPIFWRTLEQYKQIGVRIGFLFHDIIPIRYPRYCLVDFRVQFEKWFKIALRSADFFIAVSDTVRKDVLDYARENNLKTPPNDFNYSGVALDFSQSSDNQNNLFGGTAYIFVSTIEPRKNHDYAISAFEILWREKGFAGQLVIIGKVGWLCKNTLRRIVDHNEYNKKLLMYNKITDNELLWAYKNSVGLVFTSHCEGFGLPIIEGLYFGRSVFVSDTPIHREVGQDLVYYCDLSNPQSLADQIYKHSKSPRSSPRATNRPQIYSWEKSCRDLIDKILVLAK